MTNTVRRHSPPGAKRCAFTGYRPQKMPFGFNESDPRCVDFKRRVKETIQALYDMGYRHFISGGALETVRQRVCLEMADGGKIYMDCNLEKPRTAPVRVSFEGVLDAKRMKSRVGRIVRCRPSDE